MEMTLQWTLVATFLYIEVGFIFILLLPFISPTRWQQVFKSRFVKALTSYAGIYFNVILVALILLLLDAIREIVKYKTRINAAHDPHHHHAATLELVKEFRAQRNFYISGTALFLWFVMKRILALISYSAQLIADSKASKAQAESASRAAASLLEQATEKENESKAAEKEKEIEKESNVELEESVKAKDEEINSLKQRLNSAKTDLEVMVKQSESVAREYDNLLKEHAKLTTRLEKLEYGSNDNKKDH